MSKYINLPDLVQSLRDRGFTITDTADTSLTAPSDYVNDEEAKKKQAKSARRTKMTDDELDQAIEKLTRKWPQVEKRWADPDIPGQVFCSYSFMPASGVKPNKDGLYGLLKVRGVFANEEDRDGHAEDILNNVDSYHAINHARVGYPTPLVDDNDDRYCLETENIGIKEKVKEEMSKNIRMHREEQKNFAEEAEKRAQEEKQKTEAALRGEIDQDERYITLRVKRANLIFTLYQMLAGMKRYKDTLNQTIEVIAKLDEEFPHFQHTFLEKYNKAAEEVGLPAEKNHIIKYLTGPIPFDMNVIPDKIEVIDVGQPLLLPIDVNNIDFHKTAEEMTKVAKGEPVEDPETLKKRQREEKKQKRMQQEKMVDVTLSGEEKKE